MNEVKFGFFELMGFSKVFDARLNPWGKADLIQEAVLIRSLKNAGINHNLGFEIRAPTIDDLLQAGAFLGQLVWLITDESGELIREEVILPNFWGDGSRPLTLFQFNEEVLNGQGVNVMDTQVVR